MLDDLELDLAGTHPADLVTREWLVTNGLGGYASGTVLGPHTRKYHGLFVPNLAEPNGRHVLLSTLSERLVVDGEELELMGACPPEGGFATRAPEYLRKFSLQAGVPCWAYSGKGIDYQRRLVMPHGQNFLCMQYLFGSTGGNLRLRPFLALRRHDQEPDEAAVERAETCVRLRGLQPLLEIRLHDAPTVLRVALLGADASFVVRAETLRQHYRLEADRGYHAHGADYSPGYFSVQVAPGARIALLAYVDTLEVASLDIENLFAAERQRVQRLLEQAGEPRDPLAARLVVAADQFVIRPGNRPEEEFRAETAGGHVRTVIAGYHWFGDWGRDTMISLEGLTLCTGRHEEAAAILRTFAGYVRDGLVPNLFPEGAREALYHTVDATLWMFHAIDRYSRWTGDLDLIRELMPVLESIVEHYTRGTRYGIGVDEADGLVRAGAPGYQLTWMDAKAGDWVVTPRRGKPVEIQALWYNALQLMDEWRRELQLEPGGYAAQAAQARQSFNRRYWSAQLGHLYDVVDGEQGDDPSGRPNQLFSMSLQHAVLQPEHWPAVLGYVRRELLTPYGLRTLARGHPDYKPNYHGDLLTRDGAYHQGTVWPWLIGHYVDAELRVASHAGDRAPTDVLDGFVNHLTQFGVGSIAEIFDAEAPFHPRGCIAQAWSVAEVLRARLRLLQAG